MNVRHALAAALLSTLVPPAARAQDLPIPSGWRWVMDAPSRVVAAAEVQDSAWRFVQMPPGWHITMGPGGALYDTVYAPRGRFAAEAVLILFPGTSREGYGVFIGGQEMDTPRARYYAFVVRRDASAAIERREGRQVTTLATFPQAPGAVVQAGEETASNTVRVTVDRDSVHFHVNGQRVTALAKAGLEVDGRFGFRIGRDLNLHITNLDLTQRLAPPRR